MFENIIWLLKHVRTNILEAFIIPQLNISYWDFLIYLLIVGTVATVLVNAVNVTSGKAASSARSKSSDKGKKDPNAKLKGATSNGKR